MNTPLAACQVTLTERAQERIMDLRDTPHKSAMIRLYVQGGGCSGFEYRIDLSKEIHEDDIVLDITPVIQLHIDPFSAPYIDGTEIDYIEENMAGRFIFNNPQATNTCGCGSSFSVD
jgi:iron-sulfur cluster assembly accessory protein